MFWKKVDGLGHLPISSKVALTLFLCVAGLGYILGFFNIYLSYSPVDGKPGLSIADIRLAFSGGGGATKLEKAIDGAMKQNFASAEDYAKMKAWLNTGGFGPFLWQIKQSLGTVFTILSIFGCPVILASSAGTR